MTENVLVNFSGSGNLIISTRKKPLLTKPRHFLLYVHPNGKRTYLSSLYPDGQESAKNGLKRYRFEVDGLWYLLTLDIDKCHASVAGLVGQENCAIPINNAQLGSKSDPDSPKTNGSGTQNTDPK